VSTSSSIYARDTPCQRGGGIFSDTFAQAFWRYYRTDSLHDFCPPGSNDEAQVFAVLWWLKDKNHGLQ
jgi:hypothetical protein